MSSNNKLVFERTEKMVQLAMLSGLNNANEHFNKVNGRDMNSTEATKLIQTKKYQDYVEMYLKNLEETFYSVYENLEIKRLARLN